MRVVLFVALSAALMVVSKLLAARRDVHACARTGAVKRLRALLEKTPALVKAVNAQGETPVHQAAKYNAVEALRLLVEQGGDVNARAKRGETPLHLAAAFGALEAVKTLLEKGAEVDPKEATGVTPIMGAQVGSHQEVVDMLRRAGADAEAVPPVVDLGGGHFWAPIATDDPLLAKAAERARQTLPTLRQLFKELPRDAMVKFAFEAEGGQVEHVWGDLLELTEETFKVRVRAPPTTAGAKLEKVQRRAVREIEDWQVQQKDGRIRGGFTTLVAFLRTKEKLGRLPEAMAAHEGRYVNHPLADWASEAGQAD